MRVPRTTITWTATASLVVALAIFVIWVVWSTGQVAHPIEVRLTLGPLACLLLAALRLSLAAGRLSVRPPHPEVAALGVLVGFGVCG